MSYRIGMGYDIHRLSAGRKLILGGVEVPYEKGLEGHSDADVLLHAICDALLGALAKGDIGEHFPNHSPEFKNISSLILLEKVNALMHTEGYAVENIDCMIIAEEPHLKMYKPQMRSRIAAQLAISENCVNIKATTPEGMDDLGQKKGIAAQAVVLLKKVK